MTIFKTFRSTVGREPFVTHLMEDGTIQVIGERKTWEFTSDLKPASLQTDYGESIMTFRFEGAQAFSAIIPKPTSSSTSTSPEQPIPQSDDCLATFTTALAALTAVPAHPPLPKEVQDHLPEAYKLLGVAEPEIARA